MANDIFTVKINGKEQDIKMSFGLLNTLCRKVGDIDGAATIVMDQTLRDGVLIELLSDRDKSGKIVEPIDLYNLDIHFDDAVDLLDWAASHVLDFFLKGLEKAKRQQDSHLPRIKALMPSQAGSAS
jgi:hypothetical protein